MHFGAMHSDYPRCWQHLALLHLVVGRYFWSSVPEWISSTSISWWLATHGLCCEGIHLRLKHQCIFINESNTPGNDVTTNYSAFGGRFTADTFCALGPERKTASKFYTSITCPEVLRSYWKRSRFRSAGWRSSQLMNIRLWPQKNLWGSYSF